jgi:hypothetical protein
MAMTSVVFRAPSCFTTPKTGPTLQAFFDQGISADGEVKSACHFFLAAFRLNQIQAKERKLEREEIRKAVLLPSTVPGPTRIKKMRTSSYLRPISRRQTFNGTNTHSKNRKLAGMHKLHVYNRGAAVRQKRVFIPADSPNTAIILFRVSTPKMSSTILPLSQLWGVFRNTTSRDSAPDIQFPRIKIILEAVSEIH